MAIGFGNNAFGVGNFGASIASYNPCAIFGSGLVLWLKSDSPTNFTLAESGIVQTWFDSSNGNDYTQAEEANAPLYAAEEVVFDGENSHLDTSLSTSDIDNTVVTFAGIVKTATKNVQQCIFNGFADSHANRWALEIDNGSGLYNDRLNLKFFSNNAQVGNTTELTNNTYFSFVISVNMSTGSFISYVNNTLNQAVEENLVGLSFENPVTNMSIGRIVSGGLGYWHFNGAMRELMIIKGSVSQSKLLNLSRYLTNKK